MKPIQIILEIIGWLQIVLAFVLGSAIPAAIVYSNWSTSTGKWIAIILLSLGLLVGVIFAPRIWKKYGTIEWLSKLQKSS